jgi:putative DNA primase/helicase
MHIARCAGKVPYLLGQASAQPAMRLDADWLDAVHDELNCGNIVVSAADGLGQQADPKHLTTKRTGAAFDPNAEAPRWQQFLDEVLPDYDVQEYLQRLVGYTVLGSKNERVIIFLHGGGRNGKSVAVETISRVLGDYATTVSNALLKKRKFEDANAASPELASLKGARMIVTSEFEDGDQLSTGFLKHLLGAEVVRARPLYGEPISFPMTGTFWISTNHMPKLGASQAVWDRIRLVPFDVRITDEQVDVDLQAKLYTEAPGILNWILDGAAAYLKSGLTVPAVILEAAQDAKTDQDPLADFLDEWVEEGAAFSVTNGELFEVYRNWSMASTGNSLSKESFGAALADLGRFAPSQNVWNIDHTKRGRGWKGLKLRGTPSAAASMSIFRPAQEA